jgi:hypothetical protein
MIQLLQLIAVRGVRVWGHVLPKLSKSPQRQLVSPGKYGGKRPCNRATVQPCNPSTCLPLWMLAYCASKIIILHDDRTSKPSQAVTYTEGVRTLLITQATALTRAMHAKHTCHYREDGNRRRPATAISGSDRGGSVIKDPDASIRKSQKHAQIRNGHQLRAEPVQESNKGYLVIPCSRYLGRHSAQAFPRFLGLQLQSEVFYRNCNFLLGILSSEIRHPAW